MEVDVSDDAWIVGAITGTGFDFERVDLKKLRQIARAHIEKAASGDMQAIKELADRLDGKPAQILDLNNPDSMSLRRPRSYTNPLSR